MENNPNYLAELKSLPKVDRARLLEGNWLIMLAPAYRNIRCVWCEFRETLNK